jgi:2-methylisocitrate lyase-like PEP mutase family enzyme
MATGKDTESRDRFRVLVGGHGLHVVPGATNVLDARAAERCGFEAVFLTGAGIANALFGYPDIGLLTMTEMVDATRRIARGTRLPVIADADTGYGNHLNVLRTVAELEDAGAAAIVIEDQVAPKRCGHFEGKRVVPVEEMIEKVVAARKARTHPALTLVARTDAIAVEGLDAALERANAYVEAGADVIFVEAPRTTAELEAIPRTVSAPCLVNIVEGGSTPPLPAAELERMGFRFALYANLALRVAGRAVERAFESLRATGTSELSLPDMLTWAERQSAVGLPDWQQAEADVVGEALELGSHRG